MEKFERRGTILPHLHEGPQGAECHRLSISQCPLPLMVSFPKNHAITKNYQNELLQKKYFFILVADT